jgi:hypothetical protein
VRVVIFSATFAWNTPNSRKNWARYDKKMYIVLHIKYPLSLSDLNETWIFSTEFQKNTQVSNFMKFCPVWAELFCEDGRMDRHRLDEANSRFLQFCERA